MTLVIDASLVVAALIGSGPGSAWAETALLDAPLAAPHLMPVEVANILRRAASRGEISASAASLAHDDLIALPVELFPYRPFGARIWELRASLTAYDAWYVALAESLGAILGTLDGRLVRAPGPRCPFTTA